MSMQGPDSDDEEQDDRCQVITEVAIEKAMDKCGSEQAVRNQLRRIIGMDESDDEADCEMVLQQGLDVTTLANTRATRQWVMCRAWTLVKDEEMTLSSAVARAWAEAREAGEEEGFEV